MKWCGIRGTVVVRHRQRVRWWHRHPEGVNGLDFGRRDVEKRAEDRIADLVKKAMQQKNKRRFQSR
jgi:hypothetical protein